MKQIDPLLTKYCKQVLKKRLEVLRYDHNRNVWYWDYPAMIVVCHNISQTKHKNGFAHSPRGTKWNHTLKIKLESLGEIGSHSNLGRHYIIGNCAEQHAGNNYMNRYTERNMKNLYFTDAIRPRTKQIFEPCDNCKFVFPNL